MANSWFYSFIGQPAKKRRPGIHPAGVCADALH